MKGIIKISKLRNWYLKFKTSSGRKTYTSQGNHCKNLSKTTLRINIDYLDISYCDRNISESLLFKSRSVFKSALIKAVLLEILISVTLLIISKL